MADFGENLRHWQRAVEEEVVKPALYKSKYDPKKPPCYSTFTKNVPLEISKDHLPAKRPPVPSRKVSNTFGLKTTKNFVVANAVEVILNPPKKKPIDTKRFVEKEEYGKVPKYLEQVKQDIRDEEQIIREYMEDMNDITESKSNALEDFPDSEREELIKQLKRKWGTVNRNYQRIVGTDSISKVRSKEKFEAEMTQLENDIKLLQRGKVRISEY